MENLIKNISKLLTGKCQLQLKQERYVEKNKNGLDEKNKYLDVNTDKAI